MKRCICFLFVIFLLTLSPSLVYAQQTGAGSAADKMMIAPPYGQPDQLFGQNHSYSVTFRGNGEAVVSARIVFSNIESIPLKELVLRVPKVEAQDIIAFQVIKEPTCIRFRPIQQVDPIRTMPASVCDQYQEPDYFQYWGGPTKYQKTTSSLETDRIVIMLPQPVKPNSSGSVILYYRAFGYAKKNLFGAYNFTFETLKVEDKISALQVGITTDSDLMLRGTKSKVNYRFEESALEMKTLDAAGMSAPAASPRFDQYYQQIGQGEIVKTASNLQPLDSYTTRGSYAEKTLQLYAKEILGGVIGTLVLGIILFFVLKAAMRSFGGPKKDTVAPNAQTMMLLSIFGLSFISSILTLGYTVLLLLLTRNLNNFFPYESIMLVTILLLIISLAIYTILLFVPAIFVGVKKGVSFGLATVGLTVLWLVLYLVIILLFFLLTGSSRGYPQPMPLMKGFSVGAPMQIEESVPMRSQDSGTTTQTN